MSLTTSARPVRVIMAVACVAAMLVVGALPAAAAPKQSGKTYTVNEGPCKIEKLPKGASHQWTRSGESIVHKVQYGEGLQQIAYKYGFRGDNAYRRLWDANPQLKETWLSRAGITVRVPACGTTLQQRKLPKPPPPPEPEPEDESTTETTESSSDSTGGSGGGGGGGGGSDQTASAPSADAAPAVPDGSVWDALAQCESGGNWSINTGNGYYGGLQFSASSWAAVGGSGLPHQHSREEQIKRGEILRSQQGWGAWPACSAKLGLR